MIAHYDYLIPHPGRLGDFNAKTPSAESASSAQTEPSKNNTMTTRKGITCAGEVIKLATSRLSSEPVAIFNINKVPDQSMAVRSTLKVKPVGSELEIGLNHSDVVTAA